MLPSNLVLGVDKHSEDGLVIVGIHRKVLVGEGALNALNVLKKENESKIELGVMDGKGIAQGSKELCGAPGGLAGASENMPVGFCDVDVSRAFISDGSFGPMYLSVIG